MFTKATMRKTVPVTVTIPAYTDENGQPVTFHFEFHFETGELSDRYEQFSLDGKKSAPALNLERFALLLAEPPACIGDFPGTEGSSLYDRAKSYFSDPELTPLITEVLIAYNREVRPQELFR